MVFASNAVALDRRAPHGDLRCETRMDTMRFAESPLSFVPQDIKLQISKQRLLAILTDCKIDSPKWKIMVAHIPSLTTWT